MGLSHMVHQTSVSLFFFFCHLAWPDVPLSPILYVFFELFLSIWCSDYEVRLHGWLETWLGKTFGFFCVNQGCQKVLSSRLIMNSRQLLISHQRHKFLRAEESRDILKFRVSEMPFPGVFKRYFPPWMPFCFVRIHSRLETMPSKCPRHHSKLGNGCFTILLHGAYVLLAVCIW